MDFVEVQNTTLPLSQLDVLFVRVYHRFKFRQRDGACHFGNEIKVENRASDFDVAMVRSPLMGNRY